MEKLQTLKGVFNKIISSGPPRLATNCECCNKDFSLTRIKHLCKRCNRIICSTCGNNRRIVAVFDPKKTHKVCVICEKDDHFQSSFKNSNQTRWATLSIAGSDWKKLCISQTEDAANSGVTYAQLVELANNSQDEYKDFIVIDKDVMTGRSNKETFNYSMQEYLYHNQLNIPIQTIQTQIRNVLRAFCIRYPAIGYCQGMNDITVFLLSLMDEESAFITLSHVALKILPKNFYGRSLMGVNQEKFIIGHLVQEKFNLDSKAIEKLEFFLDIYAPTLLVPLFVDGVNFQVIFAMWNQMISTQSADIIRKVMLQVIQMSLDKIKDGSLERVSGFLKSVMSIFTIDHFNQAQEIEISSEKVAHLEEEFKRTFSSQWVENNKSIHYTLQKQTHFTKEEIELLQEHFKNFLSHSKSDVENKGTENNQEIAAQEGIKKKQFREILVQLMDDDNQKQEYLNTLDLENVFDVIDSDQSHYIDFKEFLFLLSVLMRGKLEEKVEFGFEVFDKGDKGYLSVEEYSKFVKSIVQASKVGKDNHDPSFEERIGEFTERLLAVANGKDKVTYAEIHKFLLSEKFVEYCNHAEEVRKRGTTVTKVQDLLTKIELTPEEVQAIKEEDEESLYIE